MNSISIQKIKENENTIEIELAYLLGALRDGCITNGRLEFYSNNKKWLFEISNMLQKLASKEPILREITRNQKTYWRLQLANKNFIQKLQNVSKFKSPQNGWATPSIILESDKEIQSYYIIGFFDAEGNIDGHLKNAWNIALYQCWNIPDKCPPLVDIKPMLLNYEIRSNRITVRTKNRKTPIFCLRMTVKKSVKTFCNMIHSYHPVKLEKINRILTS